jgi:hypothetical protein
LTNLSPLRGGIKNPITLHTELLEIVTRSCIRRRVSSADKISNARQRRFGEDLLDRLFHRNQTYIRDAEPGWGNLDSLVRENLNILFLLALAKAKDQRGLQSCMVVLASIALLESSICVSHTPDGSCS